MRRWFTGFAGKLPSSTLYSIQITDCELVADKTKAQIYLSVSDPIQSLDEFLFKSLFNDFIMQSNCNAGPSKLGHSLTKNLILLQKLSRIFYKY